MKGLTINRYGNLLKHISVSNHNDYHHLHAFCVLCTNRNKKS